MPRHNFRNDHKDRRGEDVRFARAFDLSLVSTDRDDDARGVYCSSDWNARGATVAPRETADTIRPRLAGDLT